MKEGWSLVVLDPQRSILGFMRGNSGNLEDNNADTSLHNNLDIEIADAQESGTDDFIMRRFR